MITPGNCICNNLNPGFSGIFAPTWPGRHALRDPADPPEPAAADPPTDTGRRLLSEIAAHLSDGQHTVLLRQIDLANALRINAVTVRRHTRRLQQAGLLMARRGRNAIAYTIPTARRIATRIIPEAQPLLMADPADTPPPAAAETVYVSAISPRKPSRRAESGARCPSHHKARRSWMSDHIGHDLFLCPASTGPSTHCSWIHSPQFGQIRPPGETEITLPELHARLAELPDEHTQVVALSSIAPTHDEAAADSEAQTAWRAITSVLSRWAQPADFSAFLLPATGTAFDGHTLEVTAARPSHLRWLRQSFTMGFVGDAVKEALGRPIEIRYRAGGAAAS